MAGKNNGKNRGKDSLEKTKKAVAAENTAASASAWYAYGMQAFDDEKEEAKKRFRTLDGKGDVRDASGISTPAKAHTENAPIDFLSRRGMILQERDPDAFREEVKSWNAQMYMPTFGKILAYWGFENAFDWLYDQILFKAGFISYEDCCPEPPFYTEEERIAYEKRMEALKEPEKPKSYYKHIIRPDIPPVD